MRVLVTGGAGFIGSNIVDALIERGDRVAVLDNLSTGFERNLNPGATFFKRDLCDPGLEEVFHEFRPEIINHHAAQTSVVRSVREPSYDATVNIMGSLNLIQEAIRHGVRKFIYANTGGALYGEPQYLPADEKHPINPPSPYGLSKYIVEYYLNLYGENEELNWTSLRYANVYGPRQNPKGEAGVVAIFALQMLQDKPCTIFGKGDKTRDYVHVSDIVRLNLLAMDSPNKTYYNAGSGLETTDQEIFDTLAELLKYNKKPLYSPVRAGEVYRICLSSAKAQKDLGWKTEMRLKEGLQKTEGYYRDLAGEF